MSNKLFTFFFILSGTTLLANVETIIDWEDFEKEGKAVAVHALQGPINDRSPLENCLRDAERATKRFQDKGYKLARVECVLASTPSGYQVIIHKAVDKSLTNIKEVLEHVLSSEEFKTFQNKEDELKNRKLKNITFQFNGEWPNIVIDLVVRFRSETETTDNEGCSVPLVIHTKADKEVDGKRTATISKMIIGKLACP